MIVECKVCNNKFASRYSDLHVITCHWNHPDVGIQVPDRIGSKDSIIWRINIVKTESPVLSIMKEKNVDHTSYSLLTLYCSKTCRRFSDFLEELNKELIQLFNIGLEEISK